MSYSVPYSFIPGTKARAQEVNANFNSVTDYLELLDANKVNNDLSNISAEGVDLIKNNSSRRNIGELIYTLIPMQDSNLHLLDGTLLSYGIYKEFIDYIANLYAENPTANYWTTETNWQNSVNTYGVCGKFVYDSTNNTVRLPKVTGKLDGTTDINALGDLEPLFVKLPNITGTVWPAVYGYYNNHYSISGAFANSTRNTNTGWNQVQGGGDNDGSYRNNTLSFDASLSSSVYSGNGSNTSIHEQAIKCFVYIVIATSSKTDIQTDIDEIATDLNGKADVDLSNISASQSAKNEIISWAMPDFDNTISFTGTITLPCDALVFAYGSGGGTMTGQGFKIGDKYFYNAAQYTASGNVIAPKGTVVERVNGNCYYCPLKGAN